MEKKIVYLTPAESQKHVSFRSNKGLSNETLGLLHEKGRQHGLESILPFSVNNIVVGQWEIGRASCRERV